MPVIKVEHLTKDFGSGRGIFDVNLEVNEGEVLGFLGPNGAGKTTTIRHLLGFTKPDKGNSYIFDEDTKKHLLKLKRFAIQKERLLKSISKVVLI
ncbi:ATP-binding cassette domain-containing protein [Lactococcus lactis]|uniref:ATP-binding cassette domain-containing protein n=1 Tax=Lactococcus lactis TaxID=1358 RepID=UPI00071CE917|nr:ATP-binding cassette domain-containing protein [Lactococcus lactis]KSU03099.1 ABC transporter ATP-binding protein [Lactococcus lactis subsp. lactis]